MRKLKGRWTAAITVNLLVLQAGCSHSLAGKVVGPTGESIASSDGRINVTSVSQNRVLVLTVDENGEFSTDEELSGHYLVEALVPGYNVVSQKVDVEQTRDIEFQLQPIARAKPSTIGANTDGHVGRGEGGATLMPPKL